MTTTEERIKRQEKLIDSLQIEFQSKLDSNIASLDEIKDASSVLQAAIDGLVALKTLAQAEVEMTTRDAAYAEFQQNVREGSNHEPIRRSDRAHYAERSAH